MTSSIATTSDLLTAVDSFLGLLTNVFSILQGVHLVETPVFTIFDLFIGGAFLGITADFIARVRAPRVTNA